MICNKCGKTNSDGNKFCNYCGDVFQVNNNTFTPLTGVDRLKIGWLFAILILPFGGFGMAIIPLFILWSSIYIMKKDRTFKAITNAKKYIKIYLALLAVAWAIGLSIEYYYSNMKILNKNWFVGTKPNPEYKLYENPKYREWKNPKYEQEIKNIKDKYNYNCANMHADIMLALRGVKCPDKYLNNGEPKLISNGKEKFLPEEPMYLPNKNINIETFGVVVASTVGFSIIAAFIMFLFNSLFFNILKKHEQWVVNNGIYTDVDKTYSDKVCSNCGEKLRNQAHFCQNCGHKG